MPRNSSGTYALPAGNPVSPNTIIETAWANPTMSDIGSALTDSLDRFGRGSMLAPLKAPDGTASAPVFSFSSEATLGIYRPASQQIGFAVNGATPLTVTATGITATAATINGAATITGAATIGGTLTLTGALTLSAALFTPLGTVGAPTHSFVGDTNTGMWSPGADILAWSVNGAEGFRLNTTGLGIGMTPTQKLDVAGRVNALSAYGFSGITRNAAVVRTFLIDTTDDPSDNNRASIALQTLAGASSSDSQIVFSTNHYGVSAGTRMTISSDGNVGIGGTPNAYPSRTALTLNNATGTIFDQNINGVRTSTISVDGTAIIFGGLTNLPLIFWTNSSEKARLLSGTGEFLIGATASRSFAFRLQVGDGSADTRSLFTDNQKFAVAISNGVGNGSYYFGASAAATPDALWSNNAGVTRLTLTDDGRLYGSALHNNAGAVTGTTNQYIASLTYTPSVTNGGNTSALSANGTFQVVRVGNVVLVSGNINFTVTANGTTTIVLVSLPIASNFATANQANGTGVLSNAAAGGTNGSISWVSDATNKVLRAQFVSGAASAGVAVTCWLHAGYEIV